MKIIIGTNCNHDKNRKELSIRLEREIGNLSGRFDWEIGWEGGDLTAEFDWEI